MQSSNAEYIRHVVVRQGRRIWHGVSDLILWSFYNGEAFNNAPLMG
jgi:hypothetical protein